MGPSLCFILKPRECGGCKEVLFIYFVFVCFERDFFLINILIHSNHDVILQLLTLCPAFTPTPDGSHMKELLCDTEIKYPR